MTLLGEVGLRRLAALNHQRARELHTALSKVKGVEILTPRFFNEIAVRLNKPAAEIVDRLAADGVIAGVPYSRLDPKAGMDDVLLIAVTETTLPEDITILARKLKGALA
jgi:glycine dehydrogenase subunit 1